MNHKECLQLYGVRRPLKWRRRMARSARRLMSQLKRYERWRGAHGWCWAHGSAVLDWQEYKSREGITDEQEERMREEMPF